MADKISPDKLSPLAMSPEEFRRLGHELIDRTADLLAHIAEEPVYQRVPDVNRDELLALPLPETGVAPEAIFDFFRDCIQPYPLGNCHPRFFGWVNSPPSHAGVLAALLEAAFNTSAAGGDQAAIYLERAVTRWLMQLAGFPEQGSFGLLVSGTSMATLTALSAARFRAGQRLGFDARKMGLQQPHPRMVIYATAEAHSCITKSVEMLGLGSNSICKVRTDASHRMDAAALREQIVADKSEGLSPFCVVASAGTVNTGAIDPLDSIADICAEQQLWLHVDGAYGAFGCLDASKRDLYRGLERVDSLALDPHKWLSVPIECGCVLVRDQQTLRDAFSLVPPYLRTDPGKGVGGLPWYSEYGFQQTRGFRALRLWATLAAAGRKGIAESITRHNKLAQWMAAQIEASEDLEIAAPVTLSIVCFRYVPRDSGLTAAQLDDLNKAIMESVQVSGDAFLTSTIVNGRFVLRACILHYATTQDDVAALLAAVRKAAAALS
jgi:glutamate/tyrosine decarboxylase-like PLP-dependent enzyme